MGQINIAAGLLDGAVKKPNVEPRSQQDVLSPPAVPQLRFLLEKPSVHEVTETEQPSLCVR